MNCNTSVNIIVELCCASSDSDLPPPVPHTYRICHQQLTDNDLDGCQNSRPGVSSQHGSHRPHSAPLWLRFIALQSQLILKSRPQTLPHTVLYCPVGLRNSRLSSKGLDSVSNIKYSTVNGLLNIIISNCAPRALYFPRNNKMSVLLKVENGLKWDRMDHHSVFIIRIIQ